MDSTGPAPPLQAVRKSCIKGGGGEAGDDGNNGGIQAAVPPGDWSWGTIWISDGPQVQQEEQQPAQGTQQQQAVDDEAISSLQPESGYLDNWRDQFVQHITPRPTSPRTPRPTKPPLTPRPTSAPVQQPVPTGTTSTSSAPKTTTPRPTPVPVENQDRGSCQLCSGGANGEHMSRTLIGTTVSCQDIANELAASDVDNCVMEKDKIPINLEAFCGCPGKTQVGVCGSFCPSGTTNIWHNVSIPALNDWTCQDVEDYAGYIDTVAVCSEITPIAEICCGTMVSASRLFYDNIQSVLLTTSRVLLNLIAFAFFLLQEEYWSYGNDDETGDGS
jgi:hypothetical protein